MYSKFYVLKNNVEESVRKNNFSEALDAIRDFVYSVMIQQSAPGRIVGSKSLDELCEFVGKNYFQYYSQNPFNNTCIQSNNKELVILCTGLHKYGGTSLLIGDIVKAHKKAKCTVLVTNYLGGMEQEDLELSRIGGVEANVEISQERNTSDKLKWLIQKLIEIGPARIFLLNHHQDSVIVSAVQPFLNKTKVVFYHHADHNLCLGVHLRHSIHIDPHNVGFYNCRENERLKNNYYLPLTMGDKKLLRSDKGFVGEKGLVTCSSATYHKFENFYLYPYMDLILKRLLIRDGKHVHIGNIPEHDYKIILKELKAKNIDLSRFVHIPWVPCLWTAVVENGVDLFISSFPIGGARTLIEVMGAGVPVLTHDNYLSRFHSSRDVVYPEASVWQYPEQFEEIISSFREEELKMQSLKSRHFFVKHYSAETINLEKEFENIYLEQRALLPPALIDYCPDYLDRAMHFGHLEYMMSDGLRRKIVTLKTLKTRFKIFRKLSLILKKLFPYFFWRLRRLDVR